MELLSNPVVSLFAVLSIGFILSKIKLFGVPLGLLGIILSSLIMGHFGILLPKVFETFGIILFIYAIGIQAGAGVLQAFNKDARQHLVLSLVYVGSATLTAYVLVVLFDVEKNLMLGIANGSLMYAAGASIAIQNTGSSLPLIGFGISYPFGLIGMTIFAELFPKVFKKGIARARNQIEENIQRQKPEILVKTFKVDNNRIEGKTLAELKIREITGGVISKVKHNGKISFPNPNTVLNLGDHIKVIGNQEALSKVKSLIGDESEEQLELSEEYQTETALVTNSKIVNKTLRQLNLSKTYNTLITNINRSGIDLTPHPEFKLQMGDKMTINCGKNDMNNVLILLGNNDKKLLDIDFFPISIGIVLGALVGQINFSFSHFLTISPGLIGGVIIVSMLLGKIGRTGPIVWQMSGPGSTLFQELGVLLFISTIGTNIGAELPKTFEIYGFKPFIYGAIITIFSLFIPAFVSARFFKMNTLETLESVIGVTGNASGMETVSNISKRENTKKIFALTFPITLVLVIIVVEIFSK